jgi:hypothetical protein
MRRLLMASDLAQNIELDVFPATLAFPTTFRVRLQGHDVRLRIAKARELSEKTDLPNGEIAPQVG